MIRMLARTVSGKTVGGLLAGLLGLAAVCASTSAAIAEQVDVRAVQSGKSSLITFAWRDPVAYQQKMENGRLTVRFSRPIEGRYQGVVDALKGVIADPRPGSDGRSVSFAVKAPVKVYAYYTGTSVT
ncbi:MAG: hypothetical protein NWR87_08760, partial [Rhodospirillales bacterium]|nr:hypothetical protein [Rhodospirillales bacterium]